MITTGNVSSGIGGVGTIARSVGEAASGMHSAIDRASGAAQPAVEQLASGAHHAVDRLAGAATQAASTISTRGGQWKEAQTRFTETCATQIREKPLTSLGIAVAAGFLISWLMSQRKAAERHAAIAEPAAR